MFNLMNLDEFQTKLIQKKSNGKNDIQINKYRSIY